jgi:colanic acid/amylovoran biosynthesis glycosyltransferase
MAIAYLVNQYPKVSHSFIRREILALENLGVSVARLAIRTCADELVDPGDQAELAKTQVILDRGLAGLASAFLRTVVNQPLAVLRAGAIALRMGWRSHRLLHHLVYLAEACLLREKLIAQNIHHVHAHFGTNSTTVALLSSVLGDLSYSFTVHGPEEFDRPERLSLPEKIRRAKFVVAVSSFGRSQLWRWCMSDPSSKDFTTAQWNKVHVVHCAVEDAYLSAPLTPPPSSPQLVCVGRLSEQKGHGVLLQAAGNLASEGVDFKLVLVGDGPLRSQVEAMIVDLGLRSHVEITGWASSAVVEAHLLKSKALVLPSFAEGLPVVLMESLALGRPVVSTYVAGIPELVEPQVTGWLVPAGCVDALTDSLREVLQADTVLLTEMGKQGRARVLQQHCALTEAHKLAVLMGETVIETCLQPSAIALETDKVAL